MLNVIFFCLWFVLISHVLCIHAFYHLKIHNFCSRHVFEIHNLQGQRHVWTRSVKMWILPISIHVVLFVINIKILSSSKKKWCTFDLKKNISKNKIHNQNMSVLNMQKEFWNIINFDQTFDHWNFLIDKTLSCMWLME